MTTGNAGQVEALTDALPQDAPDDVSKPRMPFKTAYILTRDQEDALVQHAMERITSLEVSLGRNISNSQVNTAGKQIPVYDKYTFMGRREIWTARYYNRVEDRPWLYPQPNLYMESNLIAGLSQRIAGQMIARANKFFFGEPDDINWFSVEPIGVDDDGLADTIRKHAPWKVAECGIKTNMEQGIEFVFVRGEAVVKTTHEERFQIYKRNAIILVAPQGQPILDAYGDFIIHGDAFVAETAEVAPPAAPAVAVPEIGNTGEVQPQYDAPPTSPDAGPAPDGSQQAQLVPTGRQILKRDGVTVLPPQPIWNDQVITRKLVTFEGPDVNLVYFRDFLCGENEPDVHTTDFVCHLWDKTVMQVAQLFRGVYGEGDAALANFAEAIRRLRTMAASGGEPKSAVGQPRDAMHEQPSDLGPNNPLTEFAECHLRYDADHDGIEEEIMLIIDRQAQAPIYYEYEANVTVRGRRPFEVWRAKAVDNRWWGMGAMEYLEPEQEVVDLEVNRHNFATGGAGRVTFWAPWCTQEGQRDPNLKMHFGGTYTLIEGRTADEALSFKVIPNEAELFEFLLNKFEQYMMLKSGTLNGADQKASGLPTANTATGINEVSDAGDELYAPWVSCLYPCVFRTLKAVIDVIYANVNREEVFAYYHGQDAAQAVTILTLTPDDVRDIALHVMLVLSRSQQRNVLQNGAQADQHIDQFYARTPVIQARTAETSRRMLKALNVPNADKVIDPMPDAGLPPPPPPHVSVSMNFKDAPDPIKQQIEAMAGMTPSADHPPAQATGGGNGNGDQTPAARPAV